jgi:hypothetical protein
MQNDFGAPGGMFERAGIDITRIAAVAEATRSVLEAARAADIPVVYVKMEHAPDLSDVGPEDGPHWIKHSRLRVGDEVVAPDGSPSRILVRDTWNTQILDSLAPEPAARVYRIERARWSRAQLVLGELKTIRKVVLSIPAEPFAAMGGREAAAALSPLGRAGREPETVAQRKSFARSAGDFARRDDQAGLLTRHSSTS